MRLKEKSFVTNIIDFGLNSSQAARFSSTHIASLYCISAIESIWLFYRDQPNVEIGALTKYIMVFPIFEHYDTLLPSLIGACIFLALIISVLVFVLIDGKICKVPKSGYKAFSYILTYFHTILYLPILMMILSYTILDNNHQIEFRYSMNFVFVFIGLLFAGFNALTTYVLAERRVSLCITSACYNCSYILGFIISATASAFSYILFKGDYQSTICSIVWMILTFYFLIKDYKLRNYYDDILEEITTSLRIFSIILGLILFIIYLLSLYNAHIDIIIIMSIIIASILSQVYLLANERYCINIMVNMGSKTATNTQELTQMMEYYHRILNRKQTNRKELLKFSGYMSLHHVRCADADCPVTKQTERYKEINHDSSIMNQMHNLVSSNQQQHKFTTYIYRKYSRGYTHYTESPPFNYRYCIFFANMLIWMSLIML